MRLRAVTYNVQSFRAGVEALRDVLEPLEADVVLLQECRSRRAAEGLARLLGMDAVTSHRWLRRPRNGVLFRPPWRLASVQVRDLPRTGRALRRGFIVAHLRRLGARVAAVSVHLGLVGAERALHARELTDFLASVEGPVVVGMDANEPPEGPAVRWLAQRYFDAFAVAGGAGGETFPASAPTARIDYLFVSDGVRVLSARTVEEPSVLRASDHRPVLADLELEPSAGPP
ncbi:MAG TPA: endonuclease/exonuclease/phosphatase family protein [Actinomycetota bacterium]|nr:endonuclease/exonuclease/phosphatase family protein [Actinomycetota bacterium]